MTFLNPFFLFGLAAASLPVLFHLFARRKSRRVEFSSLRFLRKLEKTSMRSVKIRQILLLIVRTLLIAALVLAFARPALKGYLGNFFGSSHANTSMVFLVDNSASMSRSDDRGELFKQAKDAATSIAGVMTDGDNATVIPLASIARGVPYHPMRTKREVLAALNNVHLADRPVSLSDGLRMASSILSGSHNVNKEVYLFSDDQARNLRDETGGMAKVTDSNHASKLFDASTRVFTMTLGNGEHLAGRNLSLDSLHAITTIFEPGRPIQFEAWVRNTTSEPAQNIAISLFYNGERVAQQTIASIAGGESQHLTLEGPSRGSGIIKVRAELEPDALPFDNTRFAVITIPLSRRIGIFMDDPSNASFIKLALEQTLSQAQGAMPFETEVKSLSELRSLSANTENYDGVLVGLGPKALDAIDLAGLKGYISSGHGAAVFLMPKTDIPSVNPDLAALSLPQITRKEGIPDDASIVSDAHYLSFASMEFADPFFSGMFESAMNSASVLQSIASPKIFESYDLGANAGLPLIKLSNGSPFLVESRLAKGDILLYGIPPTLDYSDFPRKSIFLPLIRRTAAYVSSVHSSLDENQPNAFVTTEPFQVRLPALAGMQAGATVLVQAPDGTSAMERVSKAPDGTPDLQMDAARVAGNYTVFRDAEARDPIAAFAVNIQSDESDLRAASPSQMKTYFAARMANPKPSILSLQPGDRQLIRTVEQSRYGVELWQSFLWAALILALIELILAREAHSAGKLKTATLEPAPASH